MQVRPVYILELIPVFPKIMTENFPTVLGDFCKNVNITSEERLSFTKAKVCLNFLENL